MSKSLSKPSSALNTPHFNVTRSNNIHIPRPAPNASKSPFVAPALRLRNTKDTPKSKVIRTGGGGVGGLRMGRQFTEKLPEKSLFSFHENINQFFQSFHSTFSAVHI